MSEKTGVFVIIVCMVSVVVGFMFFLPLWANIIFYAILGWLWGGRKVRKQQEQAEINKQEGIEK